MNVIQKDAFNNNSVEKHQHTLSIPPRNKAISASNSTGAPFWYSSQRTIPPSPKVSPKYPYKATETRKERRKICSLVCVLGVLLLFFMVFSVVITCLFLWPVTKVSAAALGCPVLPDPVPLSAISDSVASELHKMDAFIQKEMTNTITNEYKGALVANIVYRDKVIWSGSYGVMDRKDKPPRKPNKSTIFPLASVSKVFTALLLFKLFSDKKIASLDDPVVNFEPTFDVKNPFREDKMTLKELAAMRSGFQREAPCYPDNRTNLCPHDHVTMIRRIRNLTLIHDPRKRPHYSNLGYGVLGQVLAKKFNNGDFKALMKDEIFKPLGMHNSTFSLPRNQRRVPVGYLQSTERIPLEWGWLAPSGGMFSTVDDIAKMEIALMTDKNRNRFLSEKTTEEFLSEAYMLPDGKNLIGMPWEMLSLNGTVYRDKQGSVYGYESYISLLPQLRLAFNVLCTGCTPRIVAQYYRESIVPALQNQLRKIDDKPLLLPPDPRPFIGQFLTQNLPGVDIFKISLKNGKLVFSMSGYEYFNMNYTAPNTFQFITLPKMDCLHTYMLGADNDLAVFSAPSPKDGLSHRLVLYGAHPSGRTYAYRELS